MTVPVRKRVKRGARSALVQAIVRLVSLVPLRAALALATLVGRAGWRLAAGTRRQMLAQLEGVDPSLRDPDSNESDQPEFAKTPARALKPEYLVVVGVCTHLGCAPLEKFTPGDVTVGADWPGGFFCPCHGSKFDMSGRVFKDVPAPTNLPVPPYQFVSDTRILIGAEKGNA